MPSETSLINLGELSKPATILIEKIADAVGGAFRPYQIRRVAQAEADAQLIEVEAGIKITDLHRRAAQRFLTEEAQKQENIENITQKALPNVAETAKPEEVEKDWITNFFDKGRLISDSDMQGLWSRVLAGEANQPGSFSKRTVNLLSSMDKIEAELFKTFCTYIWDFSGLTPLIYDALNPVYNNAGIHFNSLQHLDLVGLIRFDNLAGFIRMGLPKEITVGYYGRPYRIILPAAEQNKFPIGKAVFTVPGQALALICGSTPNDQYRDYVLKEQWSSYDVTPL